MPAETKPCAIYCRSYHKSEDSSAVLEQARHCVRFAKECGYDSFAIYMDDGYVDRPAYTKMLSDAERGSISVIIVTDVSRLWRDYFHYREMKQTLSKWCVSILAMQDSDRAESGLQATIQENLIQYRKQKKNDRSRSTLCISL